MKDESDLERIKLDISSRRRQEERAPPSTSKPNTSRTLAPEPPGPAVVATEVRLAMESKDSCSSTSGDEEEGRAKEASDDGSETLIVVQAEPVSDSDDEPENKITANTDDGTPAKSAPSRRLLPDTNTPEGRRLCLWIILLMAFTLLAIALIVSLSLTLGQESSVVATAPSTTTPATATPTTATLTTASPTATGGSAPTYNDMDLPEYTLQSLQDAQSPQAKAYAWMTASYSNLTGVERWRKHQIFALACIYYSFDFDNTWRAAERGDWLNPDVPECDWSSLKLTKLSCECWWDNMMVWPAPDCAAHPDQRVKLFEWMHYESSLALSGTFPPELELLSSLESITIQGLGWKESLVNGLPSQVQNLGNLTQISFLLEPTEGHHPDLSWRHTLSGDSALGYQQVDGYHSQ